MSTSINDLFKQATKFAEDEQYEKEAESFLEVLKIDPDNPWAWSRLGICYMDMEEWDKAESCLGMVLEIEPEECEHYFNMAELMQGRGFMRMAHMFLEDGIERAREAGHEDTAKSYESVKGMLEEDMCFEEYETEKAPLGSYPDSPVEMFKKPSPSV